MNYTLRYGWHILFPFKITHRHLLILKSLNMKRKNTESYYILRLFILWNVPSPQTQSIWIKSQPIEQRIEDALSRMTLREKINIIHAQSNSVLLVYLDWVFRTMVH